MHIGCLSLPQSPEQSMPGKGGGRYSVHSKGQAALQRGKMGPSWDLSKRETHDSGGNYVAATYGTATSVPNSDKYTPNKPGTLQLPRPSDLAVLHPKRANVIGQKVDAAASKKNVLRQRKEVEFTNQSRDTRFRFEGSTGSGYRSVHGNHHHVGVKGSIDRNVVTGRYEVSGARPAHIQAGGVAEDSFNKDIPSWHRARPKRSMGSDPRVVRELEPVDRAPGPGTHELAGPTSGAQALKEFKAARAPDKRTGRKSCLPGNDRGMTWTVHHKIRPKGKDLKEVESLEDIAKTKSRMPLKSKPLPYQPHMNRWGSGMAQRATNLEFLRELRQVTELEFPGPGTFNSEAYPTDIGWEPTVVNQTASLPDASKIIHRA